jgi:glycosyltransferase involved in cell wall biosynthesis
MSPDFPMPPPISIVIPVYNEAERIGESLQKTLDYIRQATPESELIVVNDGSVDRSDEVISQIFGGENQVRHRLISTPRNHGKGAAVRMGMLAAQKEIGLFSDADLSTPLEEIPKLVEPIVAGEVDIAFGSRALDRRLIGMHQPWRREQAGRVFNLVVRLSTGLPFWDTQCGFKAFQLEVCRPLFQAASIDGFGFDVELLYLAQQAHLRMREIPVRWNHHGGSKVRFFHDSLTMLREMLQLRRGRAP